MVSWTMGNLKSSQRQIPREWYSPRQLPRTQDQIQRGDTVKTFEAGKTFRVSDGEFEVGPYHAGRICKNRLAVVGFESES